MACGASAHDNSDFHSGSLQEEQWRNPSEQENITSPRGALGESQHGRAALGSTRGGSGIHPPAKTPRGRDNPSSKTLDSPTKWPLAPFPCLGLEATPEDAAQLGHWCFSEALTQHELACCAARQLRPSWPGGSLPSLPVLLGDTLFPSQATSGGHHHSSGEFQLPSIQHTEGVSVPLQPTLQTPSMLAQTGHSMAPAANPRPHTQDGACWVNVFPITSLWPLFLWKKPNHLVIIFP